MKKKNIIKICLSSLFTALSVIATLMFCGFRIGFVFVDHETFSGLCYILWGLFIANTLSLFVQLRGALQKSKLFNLPIFIINAIITVLSVGASVAFFVVGGEEEVINYAYQSLELLPWLSCAYAVLFLIIVFPASSKLFQRLTAGVTAASIIVSAVIFLFPIGSFGFDSAPAVFDTGESYRIVFSTNRKSVGAVKYFSGEEEITVWDRSAGRKDSSTVHSIEIPYEALNEGGSYEISAARTWENIAYGGHIGKNEITYKVEGFTPCPSDDFNMLCVTDNHSVVLDWSKLSNQADVLVFLGDVANGIYSYNHFIDNLIVPAGEITLGKAPCVFVLGNHDRRGSFVNEMLDELGIQNPYFRIKNGEYNFTVFDTGEDKEDNNYEYGGYNDYSSYIAEQMAWAKSLSAENGYNIVLSHSRTIFDISEEAEAEIAEAVKSFGADLIICGHSHCTEYTDAQSSDYGIAYYICGSRDGKDDLKYTIMHFNGGHISAKSMRLSSGEELCSAEIDLKK